MTSDRTFRRWLAATLAATAILLLGIATYVVVVDPFMHFHKPWFGLGQVSWKESYLNPGLAKHWDYDAVVVGGSYVQNTKVSTVDATLGVRSIKLTSAGGTPANLGRLLGLALSSDKEVKTVIVAIPVTKFTSPDVSALRNELPEFLYDDNPLNDVSYLFNWEVLAPSVETMAKGILRGGTRTQQEWLDEAYSWWPRYRTKNGKAYILKHYTPRAPRSERPAGLYLSAARAQFDTHLRPAIEAHPQTTFRFFFPPFSRLLWRDLEDAGTLRAHLEVKRWLCEQLLAYPQVEVHDFMRLEQFMSDLDNYKDRTHFLPPVTEYLTKTLSTGQHRLTTVPTEADLQSFEAYIRAYDDPEIPRASEARSDDTPLPDDTVGQDLF